MITLISSHSLRLTLSAAAEVNYAVNYTNLVSNTPGLSTGPYALAGTMQILAAPINGERIIHSVYVNNVGGVANDVTLSIYNGTTDYRICKYTLDVGETLIIDDGITVRSV